LGRDEKEKEEEVVLGRFLGCCSWNWSLGVSYCWFLNLVPWAFPDIFEFSWQFSLGRFF
jgi:hypothetical protein